MPFLIDKPGIYLDVPVADYHLDCCPEPSLTQSIAKVLLDRSPAHARLEHPRLAPPAEDDEPAEKYVKAQVIGDAAHALLIGRGKSLAVGDFNDWRSKEAKAFRDEAATSGKLAILEKHFDQAHAVMRATRAQLDDAGYLGAFNIGNGEVVVATADGGTWFRSLIDWMVSPCDLWDLKTSALSCAPHAVEDRPSVMGWDLQAAMQERILDALDAGNAGRRKFRFVAQENEPPYALTVVELSEHDLTMGRKKLAIAIDIWRGCMTSGKWPAYPPETVLSRPRGYIETKWLEREIAHHDQRPAVKPAREPMLTTLAGG